MLYLVGEPIIVVYQAAAVETGATIKMDIYDQAHAKGDTPPCVAAMTEIVYNATPTGRYYATFTPNAAGTWIALMYEDGGGGEVVKAFIVDTGDEFGIKAVVDTLATTAALTTVDTEVGIIDGFHDVPSPDAADDAQMRDVVGKKTDTVAGTSIVAISKQVKAKTDNIPASPAPASEYDTEMGYLTAAVATAAALTTVDTEVGVIDGIVDGILEDTAAIDTATGATGGIRGAESDSLQTLSEQLDALVVPAMVG